MRWTERQRRCCARWASASGRRRRRRRWRRRSDARRSSPSAPCEPAAAPRRRRRSAPAAAYAPCGRPSGAGASAPGAAVASEPSALRAAGRAPTGSSSASRSHRPLPIRPPRPSRSCCSTTCCARSASSRRRRRTREGRACRLRGRGRPQGQRHRCARSTRCAPRCILALGRFAAAALLGVDEPLGKLRGRVHEHAGVPVVVTFALPYLLRHAADKARAWADLCLPRAWRRSAASRRAARWFSPVGESALLRRPLPVGVASLWRARATVSWPAGASLVMVEPPPMVAPSPTVTGATSTQLLPTCTSAPIDGAVLVRAVVVGGDAAGAVVDTLADVASPR